MVVRQQRRVHPHDTKNQWDNAMSVGSLCFPSTGILLTTFSMPPPYNKDLTRKSSSSLLSWSAEATRGSAPANIVTDGKGRVSIVFRPGKTAKSSPQPEPDNAQQCTSPITLDSDIEEVAGRNSDVGSDAAGHVATDIDHENGLSAESLNVSIMFILISRTSGSKKNNGARHYTLSSRSTLSLSSLLMDVLFSRMARDYLSIPGKSRVVSNFRHVHCLIDHGLQQRLRLLLSECFHKVDNSLILHVTDHQVIQSGLSPLPWCLDPP